jgi:hypothetical protein
MKDPTPQMVTEPAGESKSKPKPKPPVPPSKRRPLRDPTPQMVTEPAGPFPKYAKGGVTRADGCARKGHTKGRMV